MEEPAEIEFNVDEHYENEKGVFKVISIHKDEMVIRWENGEEILTTLDLQRRIAERREREKNSLFRLRPDGLQKECIRNDLARPHPAGCGGHQKDRHHPVSVRFLGVWQQA